jgi:hypothetical protein
MDQEIKELIENSRKDFDRDAQRYELLKRNNSFVKELEKTTKKLEGEIFFKVRDMGHEEIMSDLSEKNILLINDYPKTPTHKSGGLSWKYLTPDSGIRQKIKIFFDNYIPRWETFCERWHISSNWDGNMSSLRENLKGPVELKIIKDEEKGISSIIIRIDNWTILDDIKEIWGEIKKYQNEIWKKEEKRTKFARDLCWYELSKKRGLKPAEIAKIWIDKFPDEIDLIVIRRIKKEIDKEDSIWNVMNDTELLRAVKSGSLPEEYKDYFQEYRDYYITGKLPTKKSTESKFNIPFVDVIRHAIARMQEQINQMYYPYPSLEWLSGLDINLGEFPLKL